MGILCAWLWSVWRCWGCYSNCASLSYHSKEALRCGSRPPPTLSAPSPCRPPCPTYTLSLSLSHFDSLSQAPTYIYTYTYTHYLSLFLSLSLSPSFAAKPKSRGVPKKGVHCQLNINIIKPFNMPHIFCTQKQDTEQITHSSFI